MRLIPTSLALVGLTVAAGLAGCGSDAPSNTAGGGSGPSSNAAGSGTAPTAGKSGVSTAGSSSSSGGSGVVGTGGSGTNPAAAGSGQVGTGGYNSGTGGSGQVGTGGSGTSTGGTSSTGGKSATGGSGGVADPNGPDQMGKTNAKPGATTSTKFDYLKMGEIRLINNNWGSVALGCTAPMSVFINADKSFGWNFDRGACNDGGQKPDFPQLEFGIHPFGLGSSDATSPNFSSTTLLPLQIKDITSASVTLTDLKIAFDSGKEGKWDLTFEFWTSTKDPGKTANDAGVYSELMTFWGWEANRWPEPPNGTGPLVRNCSGTCKAVAGETVSAGKNYKLEVQDDAWGKWRYFQFRDTEGSHTSFPGKFTVDVKKLIDYLVNKMGYSKDLWVSRLEVGAEIGDGCKGTVTMKDVEFEVNGQKRSPVFGQ